jgi:uncharacterized membrane protein YdjX (TVP38/TMEM64 family)
MGSRRKLTIWILTAVLVIAVLVYYQGDVVVRLHDYLQNDVNSFVFLLLMLILPVIGAPLSIFVLLIGIKFGILIGLVVTALLMGLHMICTYYIVHSFLRSWIIKLLRRLNLPAYPSKRTLNTWHLVIFMLIPGLPYAIKNNLLALSGIEFKRYLLINWSTQFPMSIPLVLAGAAVIEMNPLTISIVFFLLVLVVFLQQYARKKFGESQEER